MPMVIQYIIKSVMIISISIAGAWVYADLRLESAIAYLGAFSVFISFDYQYCAKKENKHDIDLYHNFINAMPTVGTISYLRSIDMGRPIDTDIINPLEDFVNAWSNPEFEFKNKRIEKAKNKFIQSSQDFLCQFARYTFVDHNGRNAIPIVWMETNIERYNETRALLNSLANEVVKNHELFIRIVTKKLL